MNFNYSDDFLTYPLASSWNISKKYGGPEGQKHNNILKKHFNIQKTFLFWVMLFQVMLSCNVIVFSEMLLCFVKCCFLKC